VARGDRQIRGGVLVEPELAPISALNAADGGLL
jgi:hypothetical protein